MNQVNETAISLTHIRDARERAAGIIKTTPLDLSATFSALCQRQIYLKLENLQKTGSFKVRGALNKIQLLDASARARGVVTASAGNHAQGVAYAARMVGVPVTVVMPETAALSKLDATAGYGARVVRHGRWYDEAYAHAVSLADDQHATFIHAFDDPDVIAGQGTLGLELLDQLPDFDTVVVPVGGGGLLAGLASALRGAACSAHIVGVQAAGTSSLIASLQAGSPVQFRPADTIADGLATGSVGTLPFAIIRSTVDTAEKVSESEIAAAILLLLERAKTVVEGAGAVSLAACLAGRLPATAAKVVVVVSGGNIDTNLLDRIINLGLAAEGRLFRFTTRLADRPGELQRLLSCIASNRANVQQIWHQRALPSLSPTQAAVTLQVETHGRQHVTEIEQALSAAGFSLFRDDER